MGSSWPFGVRKRFWISCFPFSRRSSKIRRSKISPTFSSSPMAALKVRSSLVARKVGSMKVWSGL